jgi:hypothetical protein
MRKMQEILIQLISGSTFLFWVVMLRLGLCLRCWQRFQLATGYPISLTGHSFSNFSSGYTKYACRHSTSWFENTLFSEVAYSCCFSFVFLGTILHWKGTLWEYKRLCQVLSFSFLWVLNIVTCVGGLGYLLLPPFQNIRCFRFVKQMYLDMF